jgi:hypothetical protein
MRTKVTLSPKELELVNNAGWILTKNAIIQKVYLMFGGLSDVYRDAIEKNDRFTIEDIGIRSPKISKGEQYEGLPWVMLDYPRNFSGQDAFGIRSFFWWGNFCSITLQLSGRFQEKYAPVIEDYFQTHGVDSENCRDWFIGTGEDPWKHYFRKDNYEPIGQLKPGSLSTLPFIKLAKKRPLQDWDQLDDFFERNYSEILQMLTAR